jgi:hypothetical protein
MLSAIQEVWSSVEYYIEFAEGDSESEMSRRYREGGKSTQGGNEGVQDNASGQGVTARPKGGRWEGWRPVVAESIQVRRQNRQAFSTSGREAVTQPGGAQPATAAAEVNNALVHGGGEAILRMSWL